MMFACQSLAKLSTWKKGEKTEKLMDLSSYKAVCLKCIYSVFTVYCRLVYTE